MTPDVNVLVAASRQDHAHHAPAYAWLAGALERAASGSPFTLLPIVASGFVRIVTHPRIFREPTPLADAFAFTSVLRQSPGAEWAALESEWLHLERLCLRHDLRGNDVPDAWIAAAVLDRSGHLVTFDKGFRRFLPPDQLTVLPPAE